MSKYFLHIDEPCSQNWNEMAPAENGKFCSSCNKSVFDFTTASDDEIARYMDKHKDKELICGRFRESQLDKWLHIAEAKRTNPALYKLLLSAALITAGQSLYAQAEIKQQPAPQSLADSVQKKVVSYGEYSDEECKPKLIITTTSAGVFENSRMRIGQVRSISGEAPPLLIIDGSLCPLATLIKISPDKIKSQKILTSIDAIAKYGPDAVCGVIIIKTKYSKKEREKLFDPTE